jgi:hypothetical protein
MHVYVRRRGNVVLHKLIVSRRLKLRNLKFLEKSLLGLIAISLSSSPVPSTTPPTSLFLLQPTPYIYHYKMSEEEEHPTFEAVSLLAVLHSLSINLVYRSVRAPRRLSPCNVLLCAKTVTSSSKVPASCLILRRVNRFTQAALARSLTCPPPRLESTVTPKSILLLLMYFFSQLL